MLVLNQILGSCQEGCIVVGVRKLHATLAAPVVATIVSALAIATYGAEPCTYASVHIGGISSHILHLVGEGRVEGPSTIVVPTVVDDEACRTYAVLVVHLLLPLGKDFHHGTNLHVGVLLTGSCIVAVDIEFIPADVAGECTPGYCTLALGVSKE